MRSNVLRRLVLALHLILIAGIPAWLGWERLWLVLPLVLPLPGLWRRRLYIYAATSLLLVFYSGGLLVEAIGGGWAANALASVAVLEFCSLMLFVRVRAAEIRNQRG